MLESFFIGCFSGTMFTPDKRSPQLFPATDSNLFIEKREFFWMDAGVVLIDELSL